MFINFTNHPSDNWSESQRKAANQFGEIIDLPFPNICESLDEAEIEKLASGYFEKIKTISKQCPCIVHIMGEMTFTYTTVNLLKVAGYTCVASTTKRIVEEQPDGSKNVKFNFCQFRKYQ